MITKFQEYQRATAKTAIYPKERAIEYCILGLVGEAGEIANKYKKIIRDNRGVLTQEHRDKISDECGDVFWYLSELSTNLGVSLSSLADSNIKKLKQRKEKKTLGGDGDKR